MSKGKRSKGMNKRARIGDVIEIPTKNGFVYAQYSHKNELMGDLLRILPGTFEERPGEFSDIVQQKELYSVFFPVRDAIRKEALRIVASEEIPEAARHFPLFKAANTNHILKITDWWLWDGNNEWRVGRTLTEEQKRLSMREVVTGNDILIERLERNWRPEHEV